MRNVAVIGDGNVEPGSELYNVAFEVGKLIAKRGYVLVCGGLYGVMEAAAKGAKMGGGLTVGILPGYEFNANPYIDVQIPTGMYQARNVLVVASSKVIIAVGGSYGTLSEIGHALKLGKKVIGYKTWGIKGIERYEERGSFLSAVTNNI
ncbi:hypothetical protein SAMN06265339_0380 [Desulfurobacterium pacificum]|uniref:TIGR00725 family protein n=1 Tax=Desulfurobacterium pacificum TaxID=240166 RepID=A0ABY1NCQ9_9BACT|nr:TIGR00725 family protein [Desulfurobacterium pacificum]SMP06486.1 hypothetical protein SAMN06265339_0380 [Desulfurobacterium pacificum]